MRRKMRSVLALHFLQNASVVADSRKKKTDKTSVGVSL